MKINTPDCAVDIPELDLKLWNFIVQFQADDGSSPTLREIGQALYLSTASVHRHLELLETWNLISIKPFRARGIKILQFPPQPK